MTIMLTRTCLAHFFEFPIRATSLFDTTRNELPCGLCPEVVHVFVHNIMPKLDFVVVCFTSCKDRKSFTPIFIRTFIIETILNDFVSN